MTCGGSVRSIHDVFVRSVSLADGGTEGVAGRVAGWKVSFEKFL